MNLKIGDIICIEGQFVKIAKRKKWQGISEFQLMEFIPSEYNNGVKLIQKAIKSTWSPIS